MQGTLGKVLGVLGWTKARRQVEGVRGRFYVRPAHGANDTGPTDDEILADLHANGEPDDGLAEVLSMV